VLGYEPSDLLGINAFALIHPDDLEKTARIYADVMNHPGEVIGTEVRCLHKNGSWRNIEASGQNLTLDTAVSGIVTNFRDITEHKLKDESLRIKEKALENSINAIAMSDMQGLITYVNGACMKIWGSGDKDELIGQPYMTLVNAGSADAVREIARNMIEHGQWEGEMVAEKKSGEQITVRVTSTVVFDENRRPLQTISSFEDITEKKEAQENLRKSEEHYSALVESLTEAVFKFKDGVVEWCNDRVEDIYGYEREELLGKGASFFFPKEIDASIFIRHVSEALKEKGGFRNVAKFERKDGSEIDIEYTISQVPNRIPVELVAVARDITDKVKAEEEIRKLNEDLEKRVRERTTQLEVVNKELEAFVYSVSYDLRAPLRSIDGFSQVLLEDYTECLDDKGKDYLNRVRSASQRMAQLIDDILLLSRLTRGEMTCTRVNLSELARDINNDLLQRAPDRQVEFIVEPEMVTTGDSRLIRVALDNLIGNAWKFTGNHEKAKIEFSYLETDGERTFFIRDDGAGFDMTYVDKLFGAFQRLHSPNEFEGTGVGLATVQRIIHRHGGKIWAESAPEQGATFFFTLNEDRRQNEGQNYLARRRQS
jgi:PAS domain S-box-containing protein